VMTIRQIININLKFKQTNKVCQIYSIF
jgi:hypothetical protein